MTTPIMAEQLLTRLTIEQIYGEERVETEMVVGPAFVALLSGANELTSLYNSETGDFWQLDHERQLAQKINKKEVQLFADNLSSEVAKFEAKIESLPEDQRALSMKRFEQLFERNNEQSATSVNKFIPQDRAGEFAGIPCQWYDMIAHQNSGDTLVGAACLADTSVIAQGQALTSFLSDLMDFSDTVKNADTGLIQFPAIDNLMPLASRHGMMAVKINYKPDPSNLRADIEVISVSTERHPIEQYQIPDGYRQQSFNESF